MELSDAVTEFEHPNVGDEKHVPDPAYDPGSLKVCLSFAYRPYPKQT